MDNLAGKGMELSTRLLMTEAIARGAKVETLDAEDNFIAIARDGKREFIKQATRTGADSYISALIMENKTVTKIALREAGISCPEGRDYGKASSALIDFDYFAGKHIVVKPKSTNFGEGVAILERGFSRADYEAAVLAAEAYRCGIIVEEFARGKEYRFLVIGGKTRAVLHRVPANVIGDGASTIRALVEKKNAHPFRGEHYEKPLEKLQIGEVELEEIAARGLTADSVPKREEQVFLRRNSNISTGGDSIDFTDGVSDYYKGIAERATAAVGAKICGVDIIIPEGAENSENALEYSVLELNFNPALHIHDFPWVGKNRQVEGFVLDLLGFTARKFA